jgi:hypothetical protein
MADLLLDFRNGMQAISFPDRNAMAYGDSTQSSDRATAFFQK